MPETKFPGEMCIRDRQWLSDHLYGEISGEGQGEQEGQDAPSGALFGRDAAQLLRCLLYTSGSSDVAHALAIAKLYNLTGGRGTVDPRRLTVLDLSLIHI